MTIDPNWPKWIQLSMAKKFDSIKGNYKIWVEGDDATTLDNLVKTEDNWAELRTNGPSARPITDSETELDVLVQVMCASKSTDYLAELRTLVGQFLGMFASSIPIYKLGRDGGDDKSLFACIQLRSDAERPIDVINWGIMNPEDKVAYCSIEGQYRLHL